ncbi:hypothetical protein CCACVL1_27201 [Corchorus capsularis]|uniref:BHLH domain-containing protein n=1 Tax=Corchorus capsularis TaxID=210143 RepID=A0A1R3GBT5_COCAP|nr:hypothetical protein CCACVL1_27201 [Corchorus capsularis]
MALAKEPISFNENLFDHHQEALEKNSGGIVKNFSMTSSSSFSSPSSVSSEGGFVFQGVNYHQPQESDHNNSLISFMHGGNNGSLLSFEQNERVVLQNTYLKTSSCEKDDYGIWDQQQDYNQWNQKSISTDPRLVEDFNCFETASNFNSMASATKDHNHGDWLYSEVAVVADSVQESGSPESPGLKRPNKGENTQALKKQCTNEAKKAKTTKSGPSKDPQSIAAKNRRERISERLKILQDLVPNGSKVDLVTMLEKAISYVKFLQLQVKVLATDEFWPVQGGKAPDISQVREAIDAILSSQRDRNSSSK